MRAVTYALAAASAAALRHLLLRLPAGDRAWLARRLMGDRYALPVRSFAGFCQNALHAWKNRQYDVHRNGEAALLARLAPFRPRVLLDVGANVGEWAEAACRHLPEATVHAFEIAPATAALLRDRAAPFGGRIVVNPFGLSDREGRVTIYADAADSTATSTLPLALAYNPGMDRPAAPVEAMAEVTTGDAYLDRHGIAAVDLLKIDVEGAERAVLDGFSGALRAGRVRIIQFEYGWLNAHTGATLKWFHGLLEPLGFRIGKLYPEGVAFKDYAYEDEDFLGPNYIACHRDRADWIEALRCPPLALA